MLFFDCNIKINNTQADNARDLDAVMLLYNLIEYSGCYTKTSGGLWQYHKDDLNDNTMILNHLNLRKEQQEDPSPLVI